MKNGNLLIFKVFILLTFLVTTSCSKDDSNFIEINGKFLYESPNCEGVNCIDYLEFIGNSQANITMGDIIFRVNYKLVGNKVELYFDIDKEFNYLFIIQDERTLIRTDNNTTWVKL